MFTETRNVVAEKEVTDSDDDGFEVLDAEPEQEGEDFKYLSTLLKDFTNAGTIIFCHMNDEYNSIQQVSCQYIRPEGWNEQDKDEIAIFEVGWMNTEEALAKIPVDRNIPQGYPLGSVDLTEFAFRKEEYAPYPGEVSHFQFCYLRDGVLLGASTPFGIRGIKALRRLSLMGGKPLFLPCGEIPTDGYNATKQIDSLPADSLDLFGAVISDLPFFKRNNDKFHSEKGPAHADSNSAAGEEHFPLESCPQNVVEVKKRLNRKDDDKTSDSAAELILELTQSVDKLKAEILKASKVLQSDPSMTVTAPFLETCEDLKERFQSCAVQLKESLLDCTRTFDLCKDAIKNQTPPCSLSDFEKSSFFKETDSKRQEELQEQGELREEVSIKEKERCELSELLKFAESQNIHLKETNENLFAEDVRKQLIDKETELKQVAEEMLIKQSELLKSKDVLCSVESMLRVVSEEHSKKESECQELKKSGEDLGVVNEGLNATIEQLTRKVKKAEEIRLRTVHKLMNQFIMIKSLEDADQKLELEESSHKRYLVEVSSERLEMEAKLKAVSDECGGLRSQIIILQEEAKLYKSKLGETIVELAKSRKETVDLKAQCKKLVEHLNFLESDKTRLIRCIDTLKEKFEIKRSDRSEQDILVQEYFKKSEELLVAWQQVENFQEELSRLNVQRTTLQKELLEARQNPSVCEKPCCTYEVDPTREHADCVVQSILEALEQSIQENKRLKSELDTEKERSQSLDEKLQSAAGIQRHSSSFPRLSRYLFKENRK